MDFSKYRLLPSSYFKKDTVFVAKDLVGKIFAKIESDNTILAGKIVETEAYVPHNDLANHSARGKTPRNAPMHEAGGILYVYIIYGIHHCVNIVTGNEGEGSAVLIRALEPLEGIEIMQKRRKTEIITNLCSGPGKLAKAFDITREDNLKLLGDSEFYIYDPTESSQGELVTTTRIGIRESKELPYRFYLKDNQHVSVK